MPLQPWALPRRTPRSVAHLRTDRRADRKPSTLRSPWVVCSVTDMEAGRKRLFRAPLMAGWPKGVCDRHAFDGSDPLMEQNKSMRTRRRLLSSPPPSPPLSVPAVPMRTPSVYSQDDPITAALKPSPSETEHERLARLEAEAEAKRISEKIDDDLREERERMKRRKGDVKVRAPESPAYSPPLTSGAPPSCSCSARPNPASPPSRSSSSCCMRQPLSTRSGSHGEPSSTST